MNVSSLGEHRAAIYSMQVEKLAQDQQKREGAQAVALIEASTPSSPGPDRQGSHVDVHA